VADSRRILILFAHPAIRKSRINRRLLAAARSVGGVTVHDLYEEYPDFMIDIAAEQRLLESHDVILFQHPFYWYSCPAIVKEWLDLVLEHGFAYGEEGKSLEGKWTASVLSTGGAPGAYQPDGQNRFTVRQLLAPFEQTAFLCRMQWLPPFLVQGTFALSDEALEQHAGAYVRTLGALQNTSIPLDRWRAADRLNSLVEGGAP
jgi:glutathione-regulated potassium-efflux system ancillary protein KefG